jgi:hypothetical protein
METSSERTRFGVLVLVLALAFCAVFFAPVPNAGVRKLELRWWRSGDARVFVTGNSVVDHASSCDGDKRTIPEMLAGVSGRAVVDLSEGGQRMDESVGLAAQLLNSRSTDAVVFLVSLFAFHDRNSLDLRTELFFRLVGGPLHATSLFERLATGTFDGGAIQRELGPYRYKEKDYPDYNHVKTDYFSREQQLMGCPEGLGVDRVFIEANYWNDYLRADVIAANVDDVATLVRIADEHRKRLVVVLLPIDLDDVRTLSPELAARIRDSAVSVADALRARGVPLLDQSEALPASRFADRWCACGHLLQEGRLDVATRVAESLAMRRD